MLKRSLLKLTGIRTFVKCLYTLIILTVLNQFSDFSVPENIFVNSFKVKTRTGVKNNQNNQNFQNLANKDISFNYKVESGSTYSESDEFGDEDFGFSGTYPSVTSGNYNYKDYHIIQSNHTDFFNITVISPDLPYYVTEKDITVKYSGNFFNVSFYKAKIFPEDNIGTHTKKGLKLSTYSILIYPYIQFNTSSTPAYSPQLPKSPKEDQEPSEAGKNKTESKENDGLEFKTTINSINTFGSNSKFKVEIKIDKKYFAYREKWKQLFSERGEFKISHIKSQKQNEEEQKMQSDNSNVIIDIYLKNSTSPKGFNHYKNNFDQLKANILSKSYHPRKPWDLYDLDPDKMDKEFISSNPFE